MPSVTVVTEEFANDGYLPVVSQDPEIVSVEATGIEVPEFCVQNYAALIRWLMGSGEWTREGRWLDSTGIRRRRQATYTTEVE